MKNTKIVHLRQVRDLLAEWDVIRRDILRGNVSGWIGALQNGDGHETVYLGGLYGSDSAERLKAVLKMAAARVQEEEPPLPSAANQ